MKQWNTNDKAKKQTKKDTESTKQKQRKTKEQQIKCTETKQTDNTEMRKFKYPHSESH